MGRFDAQSDVVQAGRFDAGSVSTEGEASALQFLNTGIATSMGAPVDLVNYALSFAGLGSEEPALGSEDIRSGLSAWGELLSSEPMTAPKDAKPKTMGQRIGRIAGETTGALPLLGLGAAGVAGRSAGTAGKVAAATLEGMAAHPLQAVAGEAAAITAAGAGGQIAAENFPDDPTAEALGELAGGLTPAAALTAATAATKAVPGVGLAARGAKAAVAPFTQSGARIRAERRVGDLVADPEEAGRGLEQETIADLTPAQRSGEKRLLALERAVLDEDPTLEGEFAERTAEATQQLREALGEIGGGQVAETRDFLTGRQQRLIAALDLRAQQAAAQAEQRISALTPERRASESSVIVREEIERALGDARGQERALWGQVPQEALVPTENTKTAYRALLDDLPRAQRDDMPEIARSFIDSNEFGDAESVKEIHGLYSKLREVSRKARAASEFNTARIADGIADGVLDDIDSVTDAGEAFDAARSFSRELNQKFSQGAVGRVLRRDPTGRGRVPPELTLQSTVGRGAERGAVEAADILNAAPGAQSEIGQFILGKFQSAATKRGAFDPDAARGFIEDNTEMLAPYPELRDAMLQAADTQGRALRAATRAETVEKGLRTSSRAAEFLNARPEEEIQRVIRSKAPKAGAKELRRQVRKDPTGGALAGLKSSAVDYLIKESTTGAVDDAGQRLLSGRAMKGLLSDRKTRSVVTEILTPGEVKRLGRIANELARIEVSQGRLPRVDIIADTPSSILSTAARVLAAQQGRVIAGQMGGGTVQTPGIFSNRAQKILNNLTNDTAKELLIEAVQDKDLMTALVTPTRTPKGQKTAARRFNAWLAGPGMRFGESMQDDDR